MKQTKMNNEIQALIHEMGLEEFLKQLPQVLYSASDDMEDIDRSKSEEYRHWANTFLNTIEEFGNIDFTDIDEGVK